MRDLYQILRRTTRVCLSFFSSFTPAFYTKLPSKSSCKNLTMAMRIGVARNDKQGTQPPLRRCLRHFFPRHGGDSDTCQPCGCRVAPRPVLKETRERSGATETRDRGRGSRATRTGRVRERVYERGEKRMISRHLPWDGPADVGSGLTDDSRIASFWSREAAELIGN